MILEIGNYKKEIDDDITNLKELYLYNNQINSDSLIRCPLSQLVNLARLYLENNQINSDSLIRCPLNNLINTEICISAFPVIYSRNTTHPLVLSTLLSEFDKELQKILLDDLNITQDFTEGNIKFII